MYTFDQYFGHKITNT